MPRKSSRSEPESTPTDPIASYKYPSKRKNIPTAGLAGQGIIQEAPKVRYEYNPHLPPVLRSATEAGEADQLPELLRIARQRALSEEEAGLLAAALRRHEPWLEWSGKREKPWFEVDPVALHIHERVSTQAILRVLAREDIQRDLFADPQQSYAQAVQFYRHDVDWSNRMILGDSLQVMASLARREDLAGKVQMIYLDPPYGIKFSSNFQPQLGQRDVKDREQDLTREPEMVKAYRDTWTLGIHSYLAYLRDRLEMAKELLADTGSVFVQIGDENVHLIRNVLDEVFGSENFIAQIAFKKTAAQAGDRLPGTLDYLLHYAKTIARFKYRQLYRLKEVGGIGGGKYSYFAEASGFDRKISDEEAGQISETDSYRLFAVDTIVSQRPPGDFPVEFQGEAYRPKRGYWKTGEDGFPRLIGAGRVLVGGTILMYRRFFGDFPCFPLVNSWEDTSSGASASDPKVYVVQTNTKVVERCLLMTTDPGDLVLDPTCGSGTTAYVAEQWGRRWITIDTSRVALVLAKQRILTTKFPYYKLRPISAEDLQRNPQGTYLKDPGGKAAGKSTFQCKTVPHISLKSIARNASLDPIFAKHEPILSGKLDLLNQEVAQVEAPLKEKLVGKLIGKHREHGANAVTDADTRRWLLPDTQPILIRSTPARSPFKGVTTKQVEAYRAAIPKGGWKEWEVPFDTDPDWPQPLQEALTGYRQAWRVKMDEVNQCIAANAEMEELVDKPEEVSGVVRVSGPFTVEGVIALEEGPDTPIGGASEELEAFDAESGDVATSNVEAHLDKVLRLLKASGVDFPGNLNMKFSRLEPLTDGALLHGEGEWLSGEQQERRVAVSVGPEVGNLTAWQVEEVVRTANRKGYDELVFAAFGFDAAAQAAIEESSHPKLRLHMALIRPDVAMADLLKTQPGSQLFTVFSAPRVAGPTPEPDGQFVVEVEGMDVYDPVSNTLFPTDKERIAAWFLDSDYDGRTFCVCQAFFPDKSKWDKLAKALGDRGVVDEEKFAALSGLRSLPFPRPERLKPGEQWRVAVKVIDPRGNEGLRVLTL